MVKHSVNRFPHITDYYAMHVAGQSGFDTLREYTYETHTYVAGAKCMVIPDRIHYMNQ